MRIGAGLIIGRVDLVSDGQSRQCAIRIPGENTRIGLWRTAHAEFVL